MTLLGQEIGLKETDRGSHGSLNTLIDLPSPTRHLNPISKTSRPQRRLRKMYDGLLPSCAYKKELVGKYLALSTCPDQRIRALDKPPSLFSKQRLIEHAEIPESKPALHLWVTDPRAQVHLSTIHITSLPKPSNQFLEIVTQHTRNSEHAHGVRWNS